MPTCYTLIGPPGCGKSTWRAANLHLMHDPVVISTDDYLEEMARETGRSYHDLIQEMDYEALVSKCRVRIVRAVIEGRDIILDQTNYTVPRRMLFRKSIPREYEMVGVVFEFDREELLERTAAREASTGKHVPTYIIDRTIRKMEPPLPGEFARLIEVKRGASAPPL